MENILSMKNLEAALNTANTRSSLYPIDAFTTTTATNYFDRNGITTNATNAVVHTISCWGCHGWYNWHSCDNGNSTEKAYKIVRALMKTKLVKIRTPNQFFDLIDEIVKVI